MPIPGFADNGWLPPGRFHASWDQLTERFAGEPGSQRAKTTATLAWLIDGLVRSGVTGRLLVDGSYISAAAAPRDVDVLLIAQADIAGLRERSPELRELLDPTLAEECGYSILYCPEDSAVLELVMTVWDRTEYDVPKGVLEVEL